MDYSDKASYILTEDGHQKILAELKDLKENKRKEIADRIRDAKQRGDLSENAEYEEARRDQSFFEGRIQHLESILKNCEIVERSAVDVSEVGIGCQVNVIDLNTNKEIKFKLVGTYEADPTKGLISSRSPIGGALLGKKPGEIVCIQSPKQTKKYRIIKVRRA